MMARGAWMQPANGPASPKGAWWRVLLTGFLLYAASVVLLVLTYNPNLFPTVIILGNFLVPVTFVTFLYQRQHLSHLTLPTLALSFFYGGVLGVLAASLLEPLVVPYERTPFLSALAVGVIEEFAKIWAVVVLARRVRHDSEVDGLLLGAAVGMGFAALESTGYTFTAFLSSHGSLSMTVLVTLARALHTPLGHGAWTAILGAVLFRESQERRFRITGSVLGAYLTVTLLHASWDGPPEAFAVQTPLGRLFSGPTTLSLISLAILWRVWREALDQQPEAAVTAESPESYPL